MNDFPGSSDDEAMRRLLNESVSDVEPRHSLDAIHGRTTSPGSQRNPWLWGVGAAVVATAATITAVAMVGANPGTTGARDPGFADTSPSVAASVAATERVTVPVYYVGETGRGPRLFREFDRVALGGGLTAADAAAGLAVNTVDPNPLVKTLRGPLDPDYRTDWPLGTDAAVSHSDAVITVDLTGATGLRDRSAGMTPEEAGLAIEQVIYTVQAASQTRDPVVFMLNGGRTDTVLGVPTSEPLSEGDPTEVLAQVWIIDPAEDAHVQSSGFEVTGLAAAFEANVQWELMQGDTVVKSGFTTAEECCTMSPYSFTVTAPPGDYTLVVHDEDVSDGEGFAPWQDTKNITVTE